MKTIWKLFVGDIRRITSNVVSIIIVIGLVVIPGIFTWFNVAASWDPFANTGNLKFAVANEDDGYRSDLIPVKINIGDQVVNTLRSNDQLDWTFTTKKEAINGTKSGKYYAAVVIPKNFSTRMMTFFASDGDHAEIAYYNNEKKNALAPKITGQGADTVSAQVNETFSETLTSTALSVASQLANQLDKPAAQEQLTQFNGNISDFAETLTDASGTLRTFSTLTQSARHLLESSDGLIANVSANAKSVGTTLKQAGSGVEDLTELGQQLSADVWVVLRQCGRIALDVGGGYLADRHAAERVDEPFDRASDAVDGVGVQSFALPRLQPFRGILAECQGGVLGLALDDALRLPHVSLDAPSRPGQPCRGLVPAVLRAGEGGRLAVRQIRPFRKGGHGRKIGGLYPFRIGLAWLDDDLAELPDHDTSPG